MTAKQKVGIVIFWIAVIWAVLWAVISWGFVTPAFKNLSMKDLNQTIWAVTGPWFLLWAAGIPLGALVALIGILLRSGAKGSTVWKYGIGSFLLFVISMMTFGFHKHIPSLFGIGGILILLFFFGILWLWAKERIALKNASATAADLKLAGYIFMLIAAWFT
jgi:hypothetical protein